MLSDSDFVFMPSKKLKERCKKSKINLAFFFFFAMNRLFFLEVVRNFFRISEMLYHFFFSEITINFKSSSVTLMEW